MQDESIGKKGVRIKRSIVKKRHRKWKLPFLFPFKREHIDRVDGNVSITMLGLGNKTKMELLVLLW